MSVFTPVTVDEARVFILPYGIGDIIDFQNIAAGVEIPIFCDDDARPLCSDHI